MTPTTQAGATSAEDTTSHNKWREPDHHPIVGQWHVRHEISAARDTGYLFGKNFATLAEALDFCATQEGQCRLLTHIEGEGWLRVDKPFQSYFVMGAEPTAEATTNPADLAERVCHEEQMTIWSSEMAERLAMGDWLREHASYEDKLAFYADLSEGIRDVVEAALDHPELTAALASRSPSPAVVPEVVRRLSEAASTGPFSVSGVRKRYDEKSCVIVDAPTCPSLFAFATADGREALAALADAKFFVAAANYVRTLIADAPPSGRAAEGRPRRRDGSQSAGGRGACGISAQERLPQARDRRSYDGVR
ncbi:hypothetical protein ACFQWF_15175 [Methylorubrum suomiense]